MAETVTPHGGPAPADAGVDGRTARRDRNRAAVVDALLELYRDGNLRPSSLEIAERAGLSPRSLFRYFEDVDDLTREAIERMEQRAWPLLPVGAAPGDPLADRIAALVAQRSRLFEAVAPAATVSRLQAPFQPLLAAELDRTRGYLRQQVKDLFRAELAAIGGARAAAVLSAVDVLGSFESYQLLRHDQGLSVARARAALVEGLTALLSV
jgi:AcrR family transcriptional regulator